VVGGEIHSLGEDEGEGEGEGEGEVAGEFISVRQGDVIGWQQTEGGVPLLRQQKQQPLQPLLLVQRGNVHAAGVVGRNQRTFSVKVSAQFLPA
jgi:hypothetical protein